MAAHGGFDGQPVPLGGGAAVSNHLMAVWNESHPFPVLLLSPAILGSFAPQGKDIVRFSVGEYARFCRDFSAAATAEVMKHDPEDSIVLVNDISEAPDVERLARAGFRIFTIYHVDVVAYIASIYLRGRIPVPWLTRCWETVRRLPLLPDVLRLVFENQRRSVLYSEGIIVPSRAMKEILLNAYPEAVAERVHVVPWGVTPPDGRVAASADARRELGVPETAYVLLTLSRISPEKGQDILLDAIALWEGEPDYPEQPVCLFLCGDAAYMQGRQYLAKLRKKASRLRRTRVEFPGFVMGERKLAFLGAADLYVFPSRHESYGLTLMEALAAGLPALCTRTAGALQVMKPEFGAVVGHQPAQVLQGLRAMLRDGDRLRQMGEAAKSVATRPFSASAAEVAGILLGH